MQTIVASRAEQTYRARGACRAEDACRVGLCRTEPASWVRSAGLPALIPKREGVPDGDVLDEQGR